MNFNKAVVYKNGVVLYPFRLGIMMLFAFVVLAASCFVKYEKPNNCYLSHTFEFDFIDPYTEAQFEKQGRQEEADRKAQEKAKEEGKEDWKDSKGTLYEDMG